MKDVQWKEKMKLYNPLLENVVLLIGLETSPHQLILYRCVSYSQFLKFCKPDRSLSTRGTLWISGFRVVCKDVGEIFPRTIT